MANNRLCMQGCMTTNHMTRSHKMELMTPAWSAVAMRSLALILLSTVPSAGLTTMDSTGNW